MLNEGDKKSTLKLFVTLSRLAIAQFELIEENRRGEKRAGKSNRCNFVFNLSK